MGIRTNNERTVCDAVARSLEDLSEAKRSNAYSPEDDKVEPLIEYVFTLGDLIYALEHTVVEAFDGRIQADVDFASFIKPIEDALDHHAPTSTKYRLHFPLHPTKGMKPKRILQLQTMIVDWLAKATRELDIEPIEQPVRGDKPYDPKDVRTDFVGGVEVFLSRVNSYSMPHSGNGRLLTARFGPEDYEDFRRERLKKALSKKLPKLEQWKRRDHRSLLVLESGDLALSSHSAILQATENALVARPDRPDEVWLVDTAVKTDWVVWCLIRDGVSLPDEDKPVRFRLFKPDELSEL